MDTPALLVFDGDCGFCTTSARFARRWVAGGRYAVRPWQELDLRALRLTVADVTTAAWFVGPEVPEVPVGSGTTAGSDLAREADRTRVSGAAAVAAALRHGRLPWRPLGAVLTLPGVRRLAERVYRWVAAHRYALPGGTPACVVPPRG